MGGSEEETAEIEREGKRSLMRLENSPAGDTSKHLWFDPKKRLFSYSSARRRQSQFSQVPLSFPREAQIFSLISGGRICQEAERTPKPERDDVIRMCKSKVPGSRGVCNNL